MPGKLTQKERVLRALQRAGDRGLTRVDFLAPRVVDGGLPIINIPARVEELRKEGLHIVNAGHRNECVIYVLSPPAEPWQPIVADPESAADDAVSPVIPLFELQAETDAASPYDAPDAA